MRRTKDTRHQHEGTCPIAIVTVGVAVLAYFIHRLRIGTLNRRTLRLSFHGTRLLRAAQLLPCTARRLSGVRIPNESDELCPHLGFLHQWQECRIDPGITAHRYAAAARQSEPPVRRRIIVVEGTGKCACSEIGVLGTVVVVLIRLRRREERRAVDADRPPIRHRHVPRTVCRKHLRELCLTSLCRGMVGEIVLREILVLWVLVLAQILGHIRQIVDHARHRRRPAAWVKPRTRHDVEAALVGLVLCGKRDIFSNGVARQCIELVPVHQPRIHVEKTQPVVLGRRLRVVVCTVLADAVRHLMPEHRRELILAAVQPTDQPAVDAHIVRRIARRIKDGTVVHRPYKGKGVHTEHIVSVPHEPLHHMIDQCNIACISCASIFLYILSLALMLRVNVVAEREHRTECRVVRAEHAECLRRNPPRINRLRAHRRKQQSASDHQGGACCENFLSHPITPFD